MHVFKIPNISFSLSNNKVISTQYTNLYLMFQFPNQGTIQYLITGSICTFNTFQFLNFKNMVCVSYFKKHYLCIIPMLRTGLGVLTKQVGPTNPHCPAIIHLTDEPRKNEGNEGITFF